MIEREPKPEIDKRKDRPTKDHERDCPECGDSTDYWKRPSERSEGPSAYARIDYWCPECGTHIGTKLSWMGPEPTGVFEGP